MSGRRVNPNRIKIHRCYTANQLSIRLGVHKNTVRHWQRNGLAPIDRQRPYLFHGAMVRSFLTARNNARKRPCLAGTLYCFGCREPRRPARASVEYIQMRLGVGNLRATCSDCGTTMHRRTRQASIPAVLPGLLVQIREAQPRLNEMAHPSTNCALRTEGL